MGGSVLTVMSLLSECAAVGR
eukprot:COSAG02_NODE_79259_length_112_cov_136.769231_1_plen_20_part_01